MGADPKFFVGKVVQTSRVAPNFMRLSVATRDPSVLDDGFVHFRLLLRLPGTAPGWPAVDASGHVTSPMRRAAFHTKVYTVVQITRGRSELTFDVYLHGQGYTCTWALEATGDEIGLSPLDARWMPRPVSPLLIFGDETAIPAIRQVLRRLPETIAGEITLAVDCAEDVLEMPHLDGVAQRILYRENGHITLLDQLRLVQLDQRPKPFIWFAGPRSVAVAARRYLLSQGMTEEDFLCAAYWIDDQRSTSGPSVPPQTKTEVTAL